MGVDLMGLVQAVTDRTVAVVGDAILDVYVRGVTRGLCREAPVPAIAVQSTDGVPGGAANTAVNVAALGGRPGLVAAVGDDPAATELAAALRARGVPAPTLVAGPGRRTVVKRRVVVGSHAVVRLDEGTVTGVTGTAQAAVAEAAAHAAHRADAVVISDYGLGTVTPAVRAALAGARRAGLPLVVDARNPAGYAALRPTAVTPSYAEAVSLLGVPALDDDPGRVRQVCDLAPDLLDATGAELVVTTLAAAGAVLLERGRPPFHARARERSDHEIVGAGDAFTAALALALAAGAEPPMAVELAALAATTAALEAAGTAVCQRRDLWPRLRDTAKILAPGQVAGWADAEHARGRRIVFTNGCFDLVHEGHVAFLSQAKALGDVLIVGVNDDDSVRSLKGSGRPVVELDGRMRLLAALSCVDRVVRFSGPSPVPLLETIRPHVFAKGGDYGQHTLPEADLARRIGAEVCILDYLENRSTTKIIERVRSLF